MFDLTLKMSNGDIATNRTSFKIIIVLTTICNHFKYSLALTSNFF